MTCDIVIPVCNNAAVLPFTLAALLPQTIPPGWQVGLIFSDDGSRDNSAAIINNYCRQASLRWRVISGRHAAAATARNRAIASSTADIIFLLGADIVLRPQALAAHLNFHQSHQAANQAALGFVGWDPIVQPTPLMEWMIHGGSQNDYDALLGLKQAAPRSFFYGSHLSVKRSILGASPFSTSYKHYGWEDLDLGNRLAQGHRLKLRVLHQAVGHHRHYYSGSAVLRRQYLIGQGLPAFLSNTSQEFNHEAKRSPHWIKHQIIKWSGLIVFLRWIFIRFSNKRSMPRLFLFATAAVFWQGFYSAYPQKKG